MRINMNRNDPIRSVPGGTILDVDRLIKRTLDWGMSCESTSTSIPLSTVLTSNTDITPVKQDTNDTGDYEHWDESIVTIEVLLGLRKPKNEREALAQESALGEDTPYWVIDESRVKESRGNAAVDVEESRDVGEDSGVESRNIFRIAA